MAKDEKLFQSKLEMISKRYLDSLPDKCEELDKVFQQAQNTEWVSQEGGHLSEVAEIAHRLAGSSASLDLNQ